MSRKCYISANRIKCLIEDSGGLRGPLGNFVRVDYRGVKNRKEFWAAMHNKLNLGHPKGPRKPHKWTV